MSRCHGPHPVAARGRFDATVSGNTAICREHFRLTLRLPAGFPETHPGQFIQIGCRPPAATRAAAALLGASFDWSPGSMPSVRQCELLEPLALLRRPFSLAGRVDDADGVQIDVVYRVVGTGTDWLGRLRPGEPVDLIGPLGNGFDLPPGKSLALLVGGGVGLPPMFYLADLLARRRWQALGFIGARTRDLLAVALSADDPAVAGGEPALCVEQFARYGFPAVVSTDDGTAGMRGLITDALGRCIERLDSQARSRAVLFTCGPEPMMHAAARLAQQHGVACQVCLEQTMACGMGTCQSCVVRIATEGDAGGPRGGGADARPWRYMLACTDGPVFASERVVWG